MRIAVAAADAAGMDAMVSPHFGRCAYYVLVDVEGGELKGVQSLVNPWGGPHPAGAAPELIRGYGADVVVAGGMGRRAIGLFEEWGVRVVTGASGRVGEALERFLAGELAGSEPCVERHAHGHGGDESAGGCHDGEGSRGGARIRHGGCHGAGE